MAREKGSGDAQTAQQLKHGRVIKLERGFPLVQFNDGELLRCEHAANLAKENNRCIVIGDEVCVVIPDRHDKGIISDILPRSTMLVRKDPAERSQAQVLAANFNLVMIVQPAPEVNISRLERELVLAHETGAQVAVVLSKTDLLEDKTSVEEVCCRVAKCAGPDVAVIPVSITDKNSLEAVYQKMSEGIIAVLIGKSGAGKSSLINKLVGTDMLAVGSVRKHDGKGRHTTTNREIVPVPGGGYVIDMPGVRGLGLWEADAGIDAAFPDIDNLAKECRFRDCRHESEPGCAVRAALAAGTLSQERLASFLKFKRETASLRKKKEEASWKLADTATRTRAGKKSRKSGRHRTTKSKR